MAWNTEASATLNACFHLLLFGGQVAFDLALVQNVWTLTTASGDTSNGVTVEVARRQSDGRWKYVIDSSDGAALLAK